MTEPKVSRPRPATYDHLRKKEPITRRVEVVLSDGPSQALQDAQARLAFASDKERPKIEHEIEAARRDLIEATVVCHFRSIGRKAWDALINDHPPTKEQLAEAKEQDGGTLIWNPDTFPAAAIAASCVEPKMTEEEVQVLYDEWETAELSALYGAAISVNTSRRSSDLGKGYGLMSE